MARVDALVVERDRVLADVREAGWEVPDPQGNFLWFATGERTADAVAVAEELGIVLRPGAGEGVRVSLGEPAANDLVIEWAHSLAR